MSKFGTIVAIIVVWIISFVEPSGWSVALHWPEKINLMVTITAVVVFFISPTYKRLPISQQQFWAIVVCMAIIPFILSGTWQGASYLVSFLAVYVIAQGNVTYAVIKCTAVPIAFLGLAVLYIYINGEILSGWNDNSVSLVGLFSFLYFSIFLIYKRGSKTFWLWNLVTLAYLDLLFSTDCRSGMIFAVLAVTCICFSKRTRAILSRRRWRILLLNTPLLLSFVVIAVGASEQFNSLDAWSDETLQKGIFNGRDELWAETYESLLNTYFLGKGKFLINYHNNAVATLGVFGVLGYLVWIRFFSGELKYMATVLKDNIVFGCMLSFLLIFLQQSLDLGFVGEYPNLLPYAILGLGVGRARKVLHEG